MSRVRNGLLLLLALVLFTPRLPAVDAPTPGKQVAQQANCEFTDEAGAKQKSSLRYWLHLPKNAKLDSNEKHPLLIFLHGSGERGEDLEKVKIHGPPKFCEGKVDWPFITISPQCPANSRWNARELLALIDQAEKTLPVDKRRIYISGLSMGGSGTWSLLALAPERFAAAAPMCGRGDSAAAGKMVKTPIWIFHGALDKGVPLEASTSMLEAIQKAGGKNAKLTVYEDLAHDCWTRAYNDPQLYSWMLEHQAH